MIRFFSKLCLLLFLFSYGCHVPSKVALGGQGGRTAYNISIQKTNSEEMLLNLVRIRYLDSPFFMELGNITTQFTYKTSLSPFIPLPGFNNENPFSLGGEFSWQNQPTIQYVPLEGQAFVTQLMQPINLSIIQQIIYSGWDIDRVFRLVIQSFDQLTNTPLGSGPVPVYTSNYKAFFEATKLMRLFQIQGLLQVGIKMPEENEPKAKRILQIAFPRSDERSDKLAELLGGVEANNGKYVLNMLQGFNEKGRIGVMPRSLLSCMYYLSQGIDVPKEDIQKGKIDLVSYVIKEKEEWENMIHDLIHIRSSKSFPTESYIKVKYRNNWFYISDNDLKSKRTFLLLLQLYTLQSTQQKQSPPMLTLPIG